MSAVFKPLFFLQAPMVSFNAPANIAVTDGGTLTVSGLNFRSTDHSSSVELGSLACSTAAWSSQTSLACRPVVGVNAGQGLHAAAAVASLVGTRTSAFSFDGSLLLCPACRSVGGS